ncbi:hypothetical protein [Nocardia seriolae]|uniref:hypothetical protein n=1 Tax=Nocardia seriolae TaxID=37332 RepID=UPI0005ED95F9|nr:hypothetical protein [Nocardia seriolae]
MTSESMRNDSPTSTGEAANRANRARALAELVVMAEHGDFDHLLDKQNYRARPPCWKFFFFFGGGIASGLFRGTSTGLLIPALGS